MNGFHEVCAMNIYEFGFTCFHDFTILYHHVPSYNHISLDHSLDIWLYDGMCFAMVYDGRCFVFFSWYTMVYVFFHGTHMIWIILWKNSGSNKNWCFSIPCFIQRPAPSPPAKRVGVPGCCTVLGNGRLGQIFHSLGVSSYGDFIDQLISFFREKNTGKSYDFHEKIGLVSG